MMAKEAGQFRISRMRVGTNLRRDDRMKTYQFGEHTLHCGGTDQWDKLVAAAKSVESATIVDLRTSAEIGDREVPKPRDGWGYRHLPVTGATLSEQDIDVFRREFSRRAATIIVGPTDVRAQLMVLASLARVAKRPIQDQELAEVTDFQQESALLDWLRAYLERHTRATA